MSWAMELSPRGFDSMFADLAMMDRKTGRAYLQLMGYLRRFGSVPSGKRALASILGVTTRYLDDIAWPLLQDRLVESDDKKRYFDPDVKSDRHPRAASAPITHVKSRQHQDAALTRHARARAAADEPPKTHAEAHAKTHAAVYDPHALAHVILMHDASVSHAEDGFSASFGASDASSPARAPSLSLSDSSVSDSVGNLRDSTGGERERPPACADAPNDAPTHAQRIQSDASSDAPMHALTPAPAPREVRATVQPERTPIAADWVPSKADETFARDTGNHPATIAGAFRDHYLANGDTKLDWSAAFRSWCRKQHSFGPLAIPGGKADEGASAAAPEDAGPDPALLAGTGPEAQWARVQRDMRAEIGRADYASWLAGAVLVGISDDGEVALSLATGFLRDSVRSRYADRLLVHWRRQNPAIARVALEVAVATRRTADG